MQFCEAYKRVGEKCKALRTHWATVFLIKGKVGRRELSGSFVSRCDASIISSSSSRLGRGAFFSLHGQARSRNYCFSLCAEHVLGIINLFLSCFIVYELILLLYCL